MSEWTPGPWKRQDGRPFIIKDAQGETVAETWKGEADSRLIEAAPEMYEAANEFRQAYLEAYGGELNGDFEPVNGFGRLDRAAVALDALLARIKGIPDTEENMNP